MTIEHQQTSAGAEADVLATIVDNAGITRTKLIPCSRVASVSQRGLGLSPAFATMCVDDSIAPVDDSSPVGDMRLVPDLRAAASLSPSLVWAPLDQLDQELTPMPTCQRSATARLAEEARGDGLEFLVAFEHEFAVFHGDDGGPARPGHDGPGYGLLPFLKLEGYLVDLLRALEAAGVPVEQVHPEYGKGQVELSVAPSSAVTAADRSVLVRLIAARTALRHGLRVSFSPLTSAAGIGNGAHVHFSASREGRNVFSGGARELGLTDEGAAMIGGLHAHLGELLAVFAPSVVSFERLAPGMWSGAWACWGHENREAALRFVRGTAGHGNDAANCEVKIVDPAANPYLVVAGILAAALAGVREGAVLPPSVDVDPGTIAPAERAARGVGSFPSSPTEALDQLESSTILRAALGDRLLTSFVAVHRHDIETYGEADLQARVDLLLWRY